jgi:hypothetical protein
LKIADKEKIVGTLKQELPEPAGTNKEQWL